MLATIEATKVILPVYEGDIDPMIKGDGSPVTKADLASSSVISSFLEPTGIPILGEELEKDDFETRSKWTENWCVDPLDGTKMFLMKNDEFAINIAHVVDGKAVFGVIAEPMKSRMIIGGPEYGAWIVQYEDMDSPEKWTKLNPVESTNSKLVVTCSRSFGVNQEQRLMESAGLTERDFEYLKKGSALKFFDLSTGSADMYPRFAPTMEWDIAAGQAITEALGGTIISLDDNQPLRYNKQSLYNPHFLARTKAMSS